MMLQEYINLFSGRGEIEVQVRFKNFNGEVCSSKMRPEEITKLIDPQTQQFFTEMNFDDWTFRIYKIEIDPIMKKLIIYAVGDKMNRSL